MSFMVQIAALRQLFDLAEALHSHQLVAEPAQSAAADAAAAQVADAVGGRPEESGAGAHADHHGGGLARQGQGSGAAGGELAHFTGGQTVDVALHIRGAHAGEHYPPHIPQGEPVAGEIVAKGAIQAGHLILRPDPQHGDHTAVRPQTHDFGGGAADVNA